MEGKKSGVPDVCGLGEGKMMNGHNNSNSRTNHLLIHLIYYSDSRTMNINNNHCTTHLMGF